MPGPRVGRAAEPDGDAGGAAVGPRVRAARAGPGVRAAGGRGGGRGAAAAAGAAGPRAVPHSARAGACRVQGKYTFIAFQL